MKWQLLFMIMLVVPTAFADTIYGTVNTPTTLFADILDGADYYAATNVNITITNPNLTTVVNNQPMTSFATGRYNYTYTPNMTGEHYVSIKYYNSTGGLLATGSNLLESQPQGFLDGESTMAFVTILAIGIALASLLYLTFKLDKEYMPIKLLLLLVSMGLIVLSAFVAVESVTGGTTSAMILFYAVCIVYSCFFLYVGFKLVFQMLNYFWKIGVK